MSKTRPNNPLISIVVPVLDEEGCVDELAQRIDEALSAQAVRHEIVFVDDGSRDHTPDRIAALHRANSRVKSVRFTRSFGHQAALIAGLRHARGDAVVTMDADLQHPPEFLPKLIEFWREGNDVVSTVRLHTESEPGGVKESVSKLFYRLMSAIASVPVRPAAADFRLLDRCAVDAINTLDERFVFMRGLVPWLGFSEAHFEYEIGSRFAGKSKYRWWRMFNLALDGIFSFSFAPLRLISVLGLFTTVLGIAFGIYALVPHATGQLDDAGWTSAIVLILIFGGIQLLSLGIVGEYVGRTYEEVKRRPRYVIESLIGID